MSIKHFYQEVEKGLPAQAYFLYADDPYLLKEASQKSSETIPEAERDFCFSAFDLDGIDDVPPMEQIIDVLNTIPFSGKRKCVVIENVQEIAKKDIKPLENYIANPSPYSVLILLHKGGPKAQFNDVVKKVRAITLDIRQQDFPAWIRERARQKGFEVTNAAAEYLMDSIGPDIGLLSSELEKFVLIGKNKVDVEDIMGLVGGSSDYDVFDLVNALRDRDAERAFKVAGELQKTQESYGLLGAINWHYGRMASRDKGKTAYYRKVFELLHEADIHIKTSGGTFPLEYLLIRLLRV